MTYLYKSPVFTTPAPAAALSPETAHRAAESLHRILLRLSPRETLPDLTVETFYAAVLAEASIGGDSCDAFPLTGGRTVLTVSDASGKGLDAAERIAEVRFALRAFLREHDDPRTALACLNNFVCTSQHLGGRDSGAFVTLTLVLLDNDTGAMTCLCAGGEPPLVVRNRGEVETVTIRGTALGLHPNLTYDTAESRLDSGDTVLLATDGITEARHFFPSTPAGSRGSSFLGTEGLGRLARRYWKDCMPNVSETVPELGRAIFEGVRTFAGGAFHDDACLLIARRKTRAERFSDSYGTLG
ncbi:MAG: serine/threonine-protein phosphatase [Akkermansiaceae bacterium]|nr:serine/threonine-protein phosphatase [Armatimonadota bacterium]